MKQRFDGKGACPVSAENVSLTTCPYCHSVFLGPYCAHCGQPQDTGRRPIRGLLHDAVQRSVDGESRILRSLWALLFRPGELSRAFRQGCTNAYIPAVRFYLFISLFFFVILSFDHIAILQVRATDHPSAPSIVSVRIDRGNDQAVLVPAFFARLGHLHNHLSAEKTQHMLQSPPPAGETTVLTGAVQRVLTDPLPLNAVLTEWLPRALVVFLPLLSILLWLLYIRRSEEYYFADHLVFVLNLHCFSYVAILLGGYLALDFDRSLVGWSFLVWFLLYVAYSVRRFYGQSWPVTIAKSVIIAAGYFALLALTFITVLIIGVIYG